MNRTRDKNSRWRRRGGFTLVELLVAMTVTLILIFALAQAFAIVGEVVSEGRAVIELTGNLRAMSNRLQKDLDGITVAVRPWADEGYFEYLEGIGTDLHPLPELPSGALLLPKDTSNSKIPEVVVPNMYGDIDDVLAFTADAHDAPFRGVHSGTAIESRTAEIVWFTRFEDFNKDGKPNAGEVALYRRVLLVRPEYSLTDTAADSVSLMLKHYKKSDISARAVKVGSQWKLQANSLADLTDRKNRFAHFNDSTKLYPISRRMLVPRGTTLLTGGDGQPGFSGRDDDLSGGTADDALETGWFGSDDTIDTDVSNVTDGYGHDKVLSQLLAFDVRAFDPEAEVKKTSSGEPLVPGDPGWTSGTNVGEGAFVDLNYMNMPNDVSHRYSFDSSSRSSPFAGLPMFLDDDDDGWWDADDDERFLGVPYSRTAISASMGLIRTQGVYYCTWAMHYERDGVDQDNDGTDDQGTDGLDNDTSNGVDDVGERETSPPYPVPLRGVQIRIRTWDPDSRQIRQATVVSDFVPE